jgi:hypothetical protein
VKVVVVVTRGCRLLLKRVGPNSPNISAVPVGVRCSTLHQHGGILDLFPSNWIFRIVVSPREAADIAS